ncbi:hypothetical protein FQR65_LT19376 [Abscondita terminalis]|nr:hypothetical protein FQR65_LT19376 [Abscondita terminalis]
MVTSGAILNDIISGGNFMQYTKNVLSMLIGQLYDFKDQSLQLSWKKTSSGRFPYTLSGATNPAQAAEGTIRNKYAKSIDANAIHGSDSDENAEIEGNFFFSQFERF